MGSRFRIAACPWGTVFLWSVSVKLPMSAEKKKRFQVLENIFGGGKGSQMKTGTCYSEVTDAATCHTATSESAQQRWPTRICLWVKHGTSHARRLRSAQAARSSAEPHGVCPTWQYKRTSATVWYWKWSAEAILEPHEAVFSETVRKCIQMSPSS